MKNKEIEELLNKIRNSIKTHKELNLDDDMLVVLEFDVIQWNLLLSYIEQLERRNKQLYEGFMATQEELTDYATENEQLENNRDKAIKILGNYKHYFTPTEEQNRENEEIVDNAYNILKGDSE